MTTMQQVISLVIMLRKESLKTWHEKKYDKRRENVSFSLSFRSPLRAIISEHTEYIYSKRIRNLLHVILIGINSI